LSGIRTTVVFNGWYERWLNGAAGVIERGAAGRVEEEWR